MKKYISCLIVLLALLLPMLGMEASAAEIIDAGICGENITWTLDYEGTLIVSGTGPMEGYRLSSQWPWHTIRTMIKVLEIRDGITNIGMEAFSYCDNLTAVTIPDSVIQIDQEAFYSCGNLVEVAIPESVEYMGFYAFAYCAALTDVYYGGTSDQWREISSRAFEDATPRIHYGCTSVENHWTTVTIPETCGADGLTLERCSCIFTRNKKVIPATGDHSYTPVVTPPTCTAAGYTTYTCAVCEDSYVDDPVAMLDHSMGEWSVVEDATCTAAGSERRDCKDCAYFDTQEIPELPHTFDKEVAEAAFLKTPATNTDSAVYYYSCQCGAVGTETFIYGGPVVNPFEDAFESDYYYAPVLWAVSGGITTGVDATHFAPGDTCTRGQIVTFLWRANGSPEPMDGYNPFLDVKLNDYYYKAVLWAVENGITSGMGEGVFAPAEPCTRGQVATFLWRSEKQPTVTALSSFLDVASDAYYYNAVLWAVAGGVTNGMGDGTFAPDAPCTRGQIVTFLYRAEGFGLVEAPTTTQYAHNLVDRSYYNPAGLLRILYTYNKVEVLDQTQAAKEINTRIDQDADVFFSRLTQEDLEEYASRPWLEAGDYFWYTAESEVTNNSDGVFSICVTTDWMMGGVHNINYHGLNFDMNTGKEIDLATLLEMDEADLTEKLKDTAWAYLSQYHKDALFEDAHEMLYEYTYDDFLYYFRNNQLILTFPTYALGYGASGAFTVPTGLYI